MGRTCFSSATDSPVNAEVSALSDMHLISRISAGTTSPASSKTISPFTSDDVAILFISPSRLTLQNGVLMSLSAAIAFSALHSCTVPITALSKTINNIIPTSIKSSYCLSTTPITAETMAAAIRTITITSVNCLKNLTATLCFLASASLFSPLEIRRIAASPSV